MPLLSTLGAGKWGGAKIPFTIILDANNFGSTGYLGPTSAQVTGTNPGVNVSVYTTGYIEFTLEAGIYDFDIGGAAGGAIPDGTLNKPSDSNVVSINGRGRLRGARVQGRYTFSSSQTLLCVVGQAGQDDSDVAGNPSGGGGTFIALSSYSGISSAQPFLVAGGAGGLGGDDGSTNVNNTSDGIGQAGNAGGDSNQIANSDGTNPDWTQNDTNSGGGASFFSNTNGTETSSGFVRNGSQDNLLGFGFRKGALGARDSANTSVAGGYGGGGRGSSQTTADDDKGGGGGYSGGSYGFDAESAGGGGGSFVATGFTSVVTTAGGNNLLHGYINITKV